ncbi:ketohydroxyglutarate aldolase [Pseudonocardia kunmingensis]|uniref:Ketohydroxyglutarate aldolase n=1 Tax=Pseudonocardia kunmingensis TaxID=630975 RepID=A0A543DXA7_9PSEU|nr:ketohydroxyglutarate aldolase [Pseudonocardia kunmingensis]TQM13967.1 hypothetical protein FB558_0723 [Pseudonocardia kunmingensis]
MPEKITVSVADDALDRIDDVVTALEGGGMRVEHVLRPLGVITGSAEDTQLQALGAVTGVAAVEPQRTVQLPPPESDVQ